MKFTKEEIENCSRIFNQFCESCNSLPEDAFRNDKNKFVISLFEAVFVAVCEKIKKEGTKNKRITNDSFNQLKKDTSFAEASQGSTASAGSVKIRLERARAIIELK